jgi:glyoxylase-like metal-dependent hydrolase (beta-lactamase superfamily II)
MQKPEVTPFYDERTHTLTYVVADPVTKHCVIIDPVLDFEPAQGKVWKESVARLTRFINDNAYTVAYVLETHVHADHLTAGDVLRKLYQVPLGIGARVTSVQQVFSPVFDESDASDIKTFDNLWQDGETFMVGSIPVHVMSTPGHTPADVSYLIGDSLFVGDTMFMPDVGVARCDFPGGSAADLFESVQKIFRLPDTTRVFVGHDYPSGDRTHFAGETTVTGQKTGNIEINANTDKEAFITAKRIDDATLDMPRLIIPSIQVNIRAGQLPRKHLKIPINNLFVKKSGEAS